MAFENRNYHENTLLCDKFDELSEILHKMICFLKRRRKGGVCAGVVGGDFCNL